MSAIFSELPAAVQDVLQELEALDKTYEVQLPATQNPKLVARGVMHIVRLWAVSRETGEALYAAIMQERPKVILELGTSAGYSTLWLAAAAKEYGGRVITIDSSPDKHLMAKKFVEQAGLAETVTFVCASIKDAITTFSQQFPNTPINCVFFDADKKNYARYYHLLRPHLNAHHLILADDVIQYKAAMTDFLDMFSATASTTRPFYATTINQVGHGLLIATTTSS